MTDMNMNQALFHQWGESAKMPVVGGKLDLATPFPRRAGLEDNTALGLLVRMVGEVKDSSKANDDRMRELTAQYGSLDGQIRLLNSHLERYNKLPERLERVERFIWAGSLVIGFVGVLLGGVGQRLIADMISARDTPKHEEHLHDRPTQEVPHRTGT